MAHFVLHSLTNERGRPDVEHCEGVVKTAQRNVDFLDNCLFSATDDGTSCLWWDNRLNAHVPSERHLTH